MATRSTPVRSAWRSLIWLLVIILVLLGVQGAGAIWGGWGWGPKLALDLDGGTQITLAPQLAEDQAQPSADQLAQAVSIIRQRVDAAGVAESEISTEGGSNIVVSIPGTTPDQATLDRIKASAKLEFRAVLLAGAPATSAVGDDGSTASPDPSEPLSDVPTATPTDGSDTAWITPALQAEYDDFDCSTLDTATTNVAPADEPLVTCDTTGTEKYALGPVEVSGENISDATAGTRTTSQGVNTGEWVVNLTFDGQGTQDFAGVTTRLNALTDNQNRFAVVLDGKVIIAPSTNAVITDGKAEISGGFTQESSKSLADQLKFGALPVSFTVQSQETISATLGANQLQAGLLAGLIGLLLVVIYSAFQYRLLASVTVASLVVAGILTYLTLLILGSHYGYRLSLAGVAGIIVSIGFTTDSFIVYFERIRDELRDGRSLVGSVEAGWKRALRTIYAAKGVNLLSAVVLYILAVGNVRGFALTLGIEVVIDVLVVVLFTHPMMQLLGSTRFFSSGHPLSGVDPNALGAVYRGRAEFRVSAESRRTGASREAQRRQTIAERKAAELAAGGSGRSGRDEGKES